MMKQKLVCGDKILDLSSPVVMGVLNVTPDSFSDGGKFFSLDDALRQAELLINEGASIVDIGAESTRPQAQLVTEQQELDRLMPVVEAVKLRFDTIISLDTSSPQVMLDGAKLGIGLINDVRALQRDGALQAAAQTKLPICLMHMQGEPSTMQQSPHYQSVVDEVMAFLQQRINDCLQAGIPADQLVLDVGFGFGKSLDHNLELLAKLELFAQWPYPLLVGMSRKSMLGKILNDAPVDQRLFAGLSAATIAACKGAKIIRTHDVKATKDALAVVNAIKNYQEST
jgi:dihydropteroate synthase